MKKFQIIGLIAFTVCTVSSFAAEATIRNCATVLEDCRKITLDKNCDCSKTCQSAIALCKLEEKEKKLHEAEALLLQCNIYCPTK
jgi:hypothetical protein